MNPSSIFIVIGLKTGLLFTRHYLNQWEAFRKYTRRSQDLPVTHLRIMHKQYPSPPTERQGWDVSCVFKAWASYQICKIAGCACAGNAGNVFPATNFKGNQPLVSDPGMHRGTRVTHVPWSMSGSLTRGGGENVPGIPGACATRNFAYLQIYFTRSHSAIHIVLYLSAIYREYLIW